ncbi:glycosyltransferase [Nitritalea halalkaliphila]|uniref:glycosyltransferase n=1 Tax=Nitritalea halalkaliphila TaxID=590849 RepID=UPI0009FD1855|nr:glycosyltransferase [Nitritalea halalkaliphila]
MKNADRYIHYLGHVSIETCPTLYEKSNFVFLPTLLESFSATYAEAMKMGKVLITSDLPFARGICEDAAIYVDPLNPKDIADKILELVKYPEKYAIYINAGFSRLKHFNNAQSRAAKYIEFIENL